MANTITLTTTLSYTDAQGTKNLTGRVRRTQAGSAFTQEKQSIPSANGVALDVGALISAGTLGVIGIVNTDGANPITVATDVDITNAVGIVGPGEMLVFSPKAGDVMYAKATNAPVVVEFLAIEA